jgi:hypothetical protein
LNDSILVVHDNRVTGPDIVLHGPQRYFRELSEEVLTRKMNWYNGISVDLKMMTNTMTEQ